MTDVFLLLAAAGGILSVYYFARWVDRLLEPFMQEENEPDEPDESPPEPEQEKPRQLHAG
jgi:hypothetical protein